LVSPDEIGVIGVCSRMLGRAVVRLDRIYGGRNSQVFRIECEGGARPDRYVAKQYFAVPEDSRDRLGTEFRALQFLTSRGIAAVPQPIAMNAKARCAIYESLPGDRASLQTATDDDIRQAIDFLADLNRLALQNDAEAPASASEACFSIDAVIDNVSARLTRLRALPGDVPGGGELRRFLGGRVDPFVLSLDAWTREQASIDGLRCDAVLRRDQRTLSPSDFGLHNALRDCDGRLRFVDFEYFGWDDPAKTIVDFLHHPAMDMTAAQRRAFADGVLEAFSDMAGLKVRSRLVYPWFGLKWSLILLNEFVPSGRNRRRFAGIDTGGMAEVLSRQLDCAERLLDRVDAEYRHNPYFAR
jgi:hypothetical protein